MAYDLANFSNYVDKSNTILTKTLFAGSDTGQFATKMAGVKGSTKVPHLSGAATLQSGSCASPSGSRVASEVTITVEPFTVYEDFCADDLQSKFPSLVIGAGSHNGDSLKPWEDQIIDTIVSSVQEQLELTYWRGTKGSGTYQLFDGFIAQIDAAGTAIDGNTSSATTITTSNVIKLVNDMRIAAPAMVKRDKDYITAVGDDVFDMYIDALKAANLYHYSAEHDNGVLKIGGSGGTLRRVYGLNGTDRMFASVAKNFIIGADVADEENLVEVFYDQNSDKMKVRIKGKAGVVPANIDEIVEFTVTTG